MKSILKMIITALCCAFLLNNSSFADSGIQKNNNEQFSYTGVNYTLRWSSADDTFSLTDENGLIMASGKLQPAVIVKNLYKNEIAQGSPGKVARYNFKNNQLQVYYDGVNEGATIRVTINCSKRSIWIDPVIYETQTNEDIVSLNLFATPDVEKVRPSLKSTHYVVPAITAGNVVSSIIHSYIQLNTTLSLGYAVNGTPGFAQGWGLPSHYFAGYSIHHVPNQKNVITKVVSNGYCVGLAELPNSDFWVDIRNEKISPQFNCRSDLWGHMRGAGQYKLGAKLIIAIGSNYYEAIRQYYRELLETGIIRSNAETISKKKEKVLLSPMFCTWGEQKAIGIFEHGTTDEILNSIYDGYNKSGMKSGLFVIDDKWEAEYGSFEHSETKLPHFEEFVKRVHRDSLYVGMWAAFLRCENPARYGLTVDNMLQTISHEPLVCSTSGKYYIFDVTQPEVQKVMRQQAKEFVKRYNPDLLKFDYGYEVAPLNMAAPRDMNFAGEKFFEKALEVVIGAMREENPDIVVMYYHLSPLLNKYLDLSSIDDLLLCQGDEDLEANHRIFFSALMGEIGVPTYGSSGYEWNSAKEIWFDAAPSGNVGSLQSFRGDELGDTLSPVTIAKYNGIAMVRRASSSFHIEPLDCNYSSVAHGAHASSWVRYENDKVVLIALRAYRLDGGNGVSKFKNLIETNTSLIIASKTIDEIGKSNKIAIVPYGNGQVSITCDKKNGKVIVKEHLLGGRIVKNQKMIKDCKLKLTIRENINGTTMVEWIEIEIL